MITETQAKALEAAERGELYQQDVPDGGVKTYARRIGTIRRPTVRALMAREPALLAAGEQTGVRRALTITQSGRDALRAFNAGPARHVGKARR